MERGVLKSPNIIEDFSISPFSSTSFYFEVLFLAAFTFSVVIFSWQTNFFMSLFIPANIPCFAIYFAQY